MSQSSGKIDSLKFPGLELPSAIFDGNDASSGAAPDEQTVKSKPESDHQPKQMPPVMSYKYECFKCKYTATNYLDAKFHISRCKLGNAESSSPASSSSSSSKQVGESKNEEIKKIAANQLPSEPKFEKQLQSSHPETGCQNHKNEIICQQHIQREHDYCINNSLEKQMVEEMREIDETEDGTEETVEEEPVENEEEFQYVQWIDNDHFYWLCDKFGI